MLVFDEYEVRALWLNYPVPASLRLHIVKRCGNRWRATIAVLSGQNAVNLYAELCSLAKNGFMHEYRQLLVKMVKSTGGIKNDQC